VVVRPRLARRGNECLRLLSVRWEEHQLQVVGWKEKGKGVQYVGAVVDGIGETEDNRVCYSR